MNAPASSHARVTPPALSTSATPFSGHAVCACEEASS